ncbi:MAG: Gmad2 immunoglobulin-like domain-containing protein [Patescibacteria group bacterium]|jgi:hypothetical protein
MKHLSIAMFGVIAVLGVVIATIVFMQMRSASIPSDWVVPDDDGSGVVDNVNDGDEVDTQITSVTSDSGNIVVTSPMLNEIIGTPLTIRGNARVFENTFNYRVLDADGTVLVEGYAMASAEDIGLFGDFAVTTSFDEPSGTSGTVEVFDYSAKDGSVIDLASVPVVFSSIETMTVKTYWTTADSGADCSLVVASEHRVPKSVATAHAAISQLLSGPNTTDVSNGFGTSIPQFTTLKSISINDGVATVEFSNVIESGGSCRVTSIRAQIESTLKQFPTITSVIIKTEGMSASESLQP